jgi:hypothetical protein
MTTIEQQCPICGLDARRAPIGDQSQHRIACRRCGEFLADRLFHVRGEPQEYDRLLPYLSAYTRSATDNGSLAELSVHNWEGFAHAHKATPISRRRTKLLELIAARSSRLGDQVQIHAEFDYPRLDAGSACAVTTHFISPHKWSGNRGNVPEVSRLT